jgi:tRNA pseudouridine38-40 synthase
MEPLDVHEMDRASQAFVGKHDFARFAARVEDPLASTIRHMYRAAVSKEGEVIRFDIEGSSFLPRQVRRMAGALVDVGRGRLSAAELAGMIDLKETDRAAQALSPHGLCLMAVKYEDFPTNTGDDDGNEH